MSYAVKEIFYTLQGEGARSGRAAVFCRFAGCNLWTGHEEDRDQAICQFCDTDFVGVDGPGGGHFAGPAELAAAIAACGGLGAGGWGLEARSPRLGVSSSVLAPQPPTPSPRPLRYVVFTGGEPALQLDEALLQQVHTEGFEIAIETNGTRALPPGIDWVCVSPKAGAPLRQRRGNELKLVYPQEGAPPEDFAGLEFEHFFLQPMDGPQLSENMRRAVAYCLDHPQWRIGLQTHKILGIA